MQVVSCHLGVIIKAVHEAVPSCPQLLEVSHTAVGAAVLHLQPLLTRLQDMRKTRARLVGDSGIQVSNWSGAEDKPLVS